MTYFTVSLLDGQPRLEPTALLLQPLTLEAALELSQELTVAVRKACGLRAAWERARDAGEE